MSDFTIINLRKSTDEGQGCKRTASLKVEWDPTDCRLTLTLDWLEEWLDTMTVRDLLDGVKQNVTEIGRNQRQLVRQFETDDQAKDYLAKFFILLNQGRVGNVSLSEVRSCLDNYFDRKDPSGLERYWSSDRVLLNFDCMVNETETYDI